MNYTENAEATVSKITGQLHNRTVWSANEFSGSKTYLAVKGLKAEELKPFILSLLEVLQKFTILQHKSRKETGHYGGRVHTLKQNTEYILTALLRKNLNYTEEEWIQLMDSIKKMIKELDEVNINFPISDLPTNFIVQQIERHAKKNELSESLRDYIMEVLEWETFKDTSKRYFGSDLKKTISKLQKLIKGANGVLPFKLLANDIGNEVNTIVANLKENQAAYYEIFYLAAEAKGGKPTQKFQKAVSEYIATIGKDKYRKVAQAMIQVANEQKIEEKTLNTNWGEYTQFVYLFDPSKDFIKGIVWTMADFSDKETITLLSKLVEKSYTKMPGIGPAAAGVGNACVYVLGNMRGKDGLGALSRLKLKIKQNNVKKTIDNYLTQGAAKYNVSVEELKEMAVPDFNLENASKTIAFEDYQLRVAVEGSKVKQQWFKPDGNSMKSVPSVVKNSATLTKKLKEVRKEVKEIQKVYSAQKQRIDNQFILNRTWDYETFQKYYLEHGLVSYIAKQLIWILEKGEQQSDAILVDGKWQNVQGEPLEWVDTSTQIRLWHPVFSTEEEILAWRERMIDLEWKQPIKQAFRELYILTDAEINTRSYSNRMAAHILKQHQFKTLAIIRDWKYALMGAYDDGIDNQTASKYLAEYDITAEYWIDELANDDAWNDAGIWHYVATDQVKFRNAQGAMDLIDVPPIVFSEIMRDVDLFVGVASVGNDPEWRDNNGERQEQRDYWNRYSFGDLSEIAKTRKTILERLLPRLKKIRDKATIDGKFLIVKGDLRTYKIHIGSGNILMEPNDQYLCIVPSRSADKTTDKLFIPFEGDRGLSIVLSKAFLLAEDTKITDSTITSQINRN